MTQPRPTNEVSRIVVDSAIEVHRTLGGPGLLEGVYEEALRLELESRGLRVERQKEIPIFYKGKQLDTHLRIDLLVEHQVVIECKAAVEIHDVFHAQVLTYTRQLNVPVGLLINFGKRRVKDGIVRVANSRAQWS